MERELGVTEARKEFSDLVEKIQYWDDAYMISRHGKPAAAVVPVQVYDHWRQKREELFHLIREMQANLGEDGGCAGGFAARTPPSPHIIEMIHHLLDLQEFQGIVILTPVGLLTILGVEAKR